MEPPRRRLLVPVGCALGGRLRLRLDVLDNLVEFALELLDTIADAVQVRDEAHHLLRDGRRLLEVRLAHPTEPQLLSMEGHSVGTVDGGGRPIRHQRLVAGAELAVGEHPGDEAPLMFELRVGRPSIQPGTDPSICWTCARIS